MTYSHYPLISIDLGNTSTSYGVFVGKRLVKSGNLNNIDIPKIGNYISISGRNLKYNIILSSVVPKNTKKVISMIRKKVTIRRVYEVGKQLKLHFQVKYKTGQLGKDRLVNAYGALLQYKTPCLVIDFGTAITFDFISKRGVFEGGLIVPGVETSFQALQQKAVLLPKMKLASSARSLVPRDTKSSMLSGVLNGFGSLADGLIERFYAQYGKKMNVIATGGLSRRIARFTKHINIVDPLHTIRSLALIYQAQVINKNKGH